MTKLFHGDSWVELGRMTPQHSEVAIASDVAEVMAERGWRMHTCGFMEINEADGDFTVWSRVNAR